MTVQSVLARSRLADALLRDFAPGWYLTSRWVRVQDDAVGVALLLTERLATLAREHDIPMLLVLLPSRRGFSDAGLAEPVLERAEDLGVPTMNLLEKMWAEFHDPHDRFLKHHLDAEGNRWVAEQIAARLRSLNYLVELGETENRDAQ